ncbi:MULTISPECIES: 2-amino-4-hydroxy-6-hydroxymethyldihydropteridine diphosphokinase [unclassified Shewanella]|uniref:2-amino-4-hydroxy-6- hydroxymethyldihydropteridine diphosphokinase n=1 Tax=unclassified Shewanella TaxID=196818 RepID=UPI000C84407A|nr:MULTISPECIES: 2-amino-4-hydroxy-6-hydroxymethyldihydropteridine diphosphokinase [unclassified Shewanella]MDO6618030.1 2-amino-4-hydroxy-6-hydroxymethyldihydropteridine diphosphokinase [Shewanella sp. 6_MG-2023]MDO6640985.1 2-amino-4-hydroxy-6-hydroxymethyldihydropteridine diphosphokinase [Shewanella sp. 5_MG-2023]MDO6679189.1 2-amino-4-hydroxy-6-hydroxymethyldihydropteridine diphosphokinase [Shewanella sp. 4_MG-2023]PMG30718.1 2-amino-4-hydroxy-6-hydroxymethyldihydropteridine diphosphokinase
MSHKPLKVHTRATKAAEKATRVFVALGANLENPEQQLDNAVTAIKSLGQDHHIKVSHYYRSRPMGDVKQPDYVNAVVSFSTTLSPIDLLDALQAIENEQGRVRDLRWGPRTLDLDILLYGELMVDLPRLTVPHYGMKQRSFVLIPLADIAADLVLPCNTKLQHLITTEMRAELIQI